LHEAETDLGNAGDFPIAVEKLQTVFVCREQSADETFSAHRSTFEVAKSKNEIGNP
jgi:hypothetical protein